MPSLLYIFVWWLVFRINPNRSSSNSVVCNFSPSSLLHKTILGRYVSVQKGYGSVCNFRFVTSVYLYLPHHLPTPSQVNLVSVSRRSCLNFSGRAMTTNFAFSYCGWASNSKVTLSLPPGRHALVILEDYYWGCQVFIIYVFDSYCWSSLQLLAEF